MKALLRIFRPSRKLAIIIGGVALLAGVSGGAAIYVGKDRLMGPSVEELNGLQCTDVNLVTIRKQNRLWIRKYIKTEPADGLARIKTALRVAKAVYAEEKADLVQVVVLDQNGPTLRSDIRGRAIGADVVYIPHPNDAVSAQGDKPYTARYYDGKAAENGLFFGERIELPDDQIALINASFKDPEDCVDPVAVSSTEGESKGHGKETKSKHGGEHEAEGEKPSPADESLETVANDHGAAGHSDEAAPAEEPHDAAPAGEHSSEPAPAEEHHATEEPSHDAAPAEDAEGDEGHSSEPAPAEHHAAEEPSHDAAPAEDAHGDEGHSTKSGH